MKLQYTILVLDNSKSYLDIARKMTSFRFPEKILNWCFRVRVRVRVKVEVRVSGNMFKCIFGQTSIRARIEIPLNQFCFHSNSLLL